MPFCSVSSLLVALPLPLPLLEELDEYPPTWYVESEKVLYAGSDACANSSVGWPSSTTLMKARNTSSAPVCSGSDTPSASPRGSPNHVATAICGVIPQNVISMKLLLVPVLAATVWPFGSAAPVPVPSDEFTTVFITSTAA